MIKVTAVPPKHVDNCWSDIVGYMAEAAKYSGGRYALVDIHEAVKEKGHVLWVAYDFSGIKGAVVTDFSIYPRKKFLLLEFIGGEEGLEWKDVMLETLQNWARDTECNGIESIGRPGWSKIFKEDGYEMKGYFYELPVTAGIGA
jgi:hypothetical protein